MTFTVALPEERLKDKVKGDDVTVKISNALNRIMIVFIAAGMILRLVYSAVCDESYDTVTGRQFFAGPGNTGWYGFRNCGIISVNLCIFLLCVLSGTSFKHILYIHLKDGTK